MAGISRAGRLLSVSAVALAAAACTDGPPRELEPLSLVETLGGTDTAGYARAIEPRDFVFPEDHGPHPDFKTEWWYVTGHLDAAEGRRFGYQLTLFRSALAPAGHTQGDPDEPAAASAWSTRQAYMGHFAISDIDGERFFARERFARGAAGLAGSTTLPLRIWLEGWRLEGAESEDGFPIVLTAEDDSIALELTLAAGKGIVLNGNGGLSQKSPEAGNASYYYSLPRMPSSGTLRVAGERFTVSGFSWLDREWSTSVLGQGQVGWDWFALHLDDGRDLMVYRIRRADGSAAAESEGILIAADGTSTRLSWGDEIQVAELARWTAPDGAATYPSRWTITIPSDGSELTVEPLLADQEFRTAFRYWEGAVEVSGAGPGGPITGRGYVELTGYGGDESGWR